ncbi:sigma-70 family RNA polymerase sigma factor [Lutibacter sp. A64]|uniref:RNA polymerase sigma factor n=1 Tax=Lutibacter sp. A64 TaxID=2918526 RepID=UPI001F06BC30|nr:sigma-70 family RNA polymerase sigma factor [Lutibacter sp. A64]UMB55121.1 sigma-70 family RNA polymerase sigma factor [Lutibacter sp. A64]
MKNPLNNSQNNSTINSQEQLWNSFINGDMASFQTIYNSNYQMLYNFGKRYLSSSEIEDCIHDTFLNILNYKNQNTEVKNVKAYLFKSFRNQIFKVKKNSKLEFNLIEGTIPYEEDDHSKEIILKDLKKLIKKLSPREREIVYLKYFQNFNNFEISETLDIKYQTVRNILAGAIKKLRTLGKDYTHLLFLVFN